jgi:hypothetical protein
MLALHMWLLVLVAAAIGFGVAWSARKSWLAARVAELEAERDDLRRRAHAIEARRIG